MTGRLRDETLEDFLDAVVRRDPGQSAYHQAVSEVLADVFPMLSGRDAYQEAQVLRRLVEPDRVISFRVVWEDEAGRVHVNRGWRVQHSNAIGPYKGGLRFHADVNEDLFKALAFEQTFKNALTGLSMGGAKGGADFDPHGRSDRDIMRFCQAFMTALYRHLGPDTDVPAGDIGVGEREIGYMFGQYKRITGTFVGVLTGKGLEYGGSPMRREATGHGAVLFLKHMLDEAGRDLDGMTALVSGAGNVATHAAEKLAALGARVLTLSDSGGFVHDPAGIDEEKIAWVRDHKRNGGRIADYPDRFPGSHYHDGQRPWGLSADLALPCATQGELDGDDARRLKENGVIAVVEGANMPATADARRFFRENAILYAPGKAANAGGVAVSGLEMAQNSQGRSWKRDDLERLLAEIMGEIHARCVAHGRDADGKVDYSRGANRAGAEKVADALLAFGIV